MCTYLLQTNAHIHTSITTCLPLPPETEEEESAELERQKRRWVQWERALLPFTDFTSIKVPLLHFEVPQRRSGQGDQGVARKEGRKSSKSHRCLPNSQGQDRRELISKAIQIAVLSSSSFGSTGATSCQEERLTART
jgi:hypothetical protein